MKTKVIILLAVIFILFGLYGLAGSLSKPSGNTVQKVAKPKILVWRLKEDVEPGKVINHRMLAVERLSESEAHQLGFTKDVNLDWQQGAVFRNKLIKGSYLSKHDLIQPNQDGYVEYVISENRIPYPINVDQKTVLGGVISHGSC